MAIFVAMKIRTLTLALFTGLTIASCGSQKSSSKTTAHKKPATQQAPAKTPAKAAPKAKEADDLQNLKLPEAPREFRAAWIATVANINWPSKGNYSTESQKREVIQILDMLKDANFNAVVFQARPSADALYKSSLEPWSYFLTGEQGRAPQPYYDPLEFWIAEAHRRGMELHVWLNPYRAHHSAGGPLTSESMVNRMPEQVVRLKNGMYWMDPSDERVQNHVSAVIKDLVKRYDIDAIHIDDYFYPYREYNGGADFPDSRTWAAYQRAGGTMSRADWRRANVNQFIKRINTEIKAEKPYVKFGISPFGVWKPGYPADIKGSSQYDELYADAKLWLNEGWCDYFSPQLYWKDGGPQSYSSLLKWWEQENSKRIHLWPGLNTIGVKAADKPAEIARQIQITRNTLGHDAGVIHYSMDGISKSREMLQTLKGLYSDAALVPPTPWLKSEKLIKPEITAKKSANSVEADWLSRSPEQPRNWILYCKYGDQWETKILDAGQTSANLPFNKNGKVLEIIALKAVDRLGKESDYTAIRIK